MKNSNWVVLIIVCALSTIVLNAGAISSDLVGLDGKLRNLSDLRSGIVVVNFWATWCVPCRKEIPILNDVYRRYAGRGVRVIGISVDDAETSDQIEAFLKKVPIEYDVWRNGAAAHMSQLGFQFAIPSTAILDSNGKVVERITGKLTAAKLGKEIERLLSKR